MLVLSRRVGERLRIGDDIIITILSNRRTGQISIGIDAPKEVKILRVELDDHDQKEEGRN